MTDTATKHQREVRLTRTLDAARDTVFKGWTSSNELAKWWGPHHFTNPICEIDLRPGGKMLIVMRAPDGAEYPMPAVIREVTPPEKFAFTNFALDAQGNKQLEGSTTVTFNDEGEKTRMTIHSTAAGQGPIAKQMLDGMDAGWAQSLERLEALVTRK